MKQTMLLKLAPTAEQHRALLKTMCALNAGANYVAEVAFNEKSANKFALQKLVYGALRSTYNLPAQLAIRAIAKQVKHTSVTRASNHTSRQKERLSMISVSWPLRG